MRYSRVSLAGLGYELPPQVVSSEALEDRLAPVYERLGLHSGRLELMTGIKERRFWSHDVRPSEVAALAGAKALAASGIPKESIGALIHASVCRDFLEPATANVVHHTLGLPGQASVFDVSNACLGVLNGVLLVANMIELGQIQAGLVVAGENGRPLVDSTIAALLSDASVTRKSIKGSFASLTIGSGAFAVVVSRSDLAPAGHRLNGATVAAATEHHALCSGGGVGSGDAGMSASSAIQMSTDAEALLHAGVALARENWRRCKEELGFRTRLPDRVMTHQIGKAHHLAMFDALELPRDRGFTTYETLGNVGSVSLPISLALAAEAGFVERGHEVALLGIGSGLSTIMAGVTW